MARPLRHPPRRRRLRPRRPRRRPKARIRRFAVYRIVRAAFVIATVAWRYWWLQKRNASQERWDRAHAKTGRAIYKLATNLGGAFVKLGQVLGSRGDVLPAPLVEPLRGLHDRVPARPFEKLRKHVEQQLALAEQPAPTTNSRSRTDRGRADNERPSSARGGRETTSAVDGDEVPIAERDRWVTSRRRPIDEVFASVEPTAIAAASLAQVHRAKLLDGTDVVIKIQYPEARRLFPIDLGSLRRAVRVGRWLNKSLDMRPLVDELAHFVTLELDFTREVRSTQRVRANLLADPPWDTKVIVPQIYAELSTGKLIVLGFLSGTPLSRIDKLRERGVDLKDVACRVAELYARMIFTHGFFHGDPHPGNIFVLDDGKLGLLDFGLAKELPAGFAANAARMIAAGMRGDTGRALEAARAIGFVVTEARAPELITLIKALLGDYEKAGDLLKQLAPGELEIPSHFTLIGRVMIILSGVSHSLVPKERIIAGALLAALAPHMISAKAS